MPRSKGTLKRTATAASAIALAIAAALVPASEAFAAGGEAGCAVENVGYGWTCTSASISANSSHQLYYDINAGYVNGSSWLIVDEDNGSVVFRGRVGIVNSPGCGRVDGLYGRYYLQVFDSGYGGGGNIAPYRMC